MLSKAKKGSPVSARLAELFEISVTIFDPGGSSETRFDNRKAEEVRHK
jgi:hypothetical protein